MKATTKDGQTKAVCHPSKPNFGRGLCSACYFKERREATNRITGKAKPLRGILEAEALLPPRDIKHAIELAEQELLMALPEAARALRKAIVEGDPDRGFSIKAAVAVLRGVAVPGGAKGLKRLLAGPEKAPEGPAPTQVVIGLHIASGEVKAGRVVGTIAAPTGESG